MPFVPWPYVFCNSGFKNMLSTVTPAFTVIPNPLCFLPDFVVIKITPLPAREPYNAAAEAPFNTFMDSISSGLISDKPLPISTPLLPQASSTPPVKLSIGIPSTTINGWLDPVNELLPRNTIFEEPPGPLLERTTCKPDTLPDNAFAILLSRAFTSSSPFNSCVAYPNAFFSRLIPKAVTTTSSNFWVSSANLITPTGLPVYVSSMVE